MAPLSTSLNSYDVAVVGVGAMGAATCDALARRGIRVVGIDRFDAVHEMGSSGGETRLIRKVYWEHPDYVPLVLSAYQHWAELEERSEQKLLLRTGCLSIGPRDGDLIPGTLLAAEEHDLVMEELSRSECTERFPQFDLDRTFDSTTDVAVLMDAEAGVVLCEQAIRAQIESARRHGAELRFGEEVRNFRHHTGGVTIETDKGTVQAGHLVVTAGAWTSQLLKDLDVQLRVHRQVLSWTRPVNAEDFEIGRYPAWLVELGTDVDGGNTYAFPVMPKGSGCPLSEQGPKVGFHHPGAPVDPDSVERETHAADELHWRPTMDRLVPTAGPTFQSKVCLYTMSPDGHFIIDRHPTLENVTFAAGFSGHGFKFASVIGEVLADLASEGTTSHPIDFLRLHRFDS